MGTDKNNIIEKYPNIFSIIPSAKKWYKPEIQKSINDILAKRVGESGRQFYEDAKYFYGSAEKIPDEICCALFQLDTTPHEYIIEMLDTHNNDVAIEFLASPHKCTNMAITFAIKKLWHEMDAIKDYYEFHKKTDDDMVFSQSIIDELARYRILEVLRNSELNFILKFTTNESVINDSLDQEILNQEQLLLIAENQKLDDDTRDKAINLIEDIYSIKNMTPKLKKTLYHSAVETMFDFNNKDNTAKTLAQQYLYNATIEPTRMLNRALEYDLINRCLEFETKTTHFLSSSDIRMRILLSLMENTKDAAILKETYFRTKNEISREVILKNPKIQPDIAAGKMISLIDKIKESPSFENGKLLLDIAHKDVVRFVEPEKFEHIIKNNLSNNAHVLSLIPDMHTETLEKILEKNHNARAKILAYTNLKLRNSNTTYDETKTFLNIMNCALNAITSSFFKNDNSLNVNIFETISKPEYETLSKILKFAIKTSKKAFLSSAIIDRLKSIQKHLNDVYDEKVRNLSPNLKHHTNKNIINTTQSICDELNKIDNKFEFYMFMSKCADGNEKHLEEFNRRVKSKKINFTELSPDLKLISRIILSPYDTITEKIQDIKKTIEPKSEER